jgi:1-acyl-sn-glycerol-3-phosphate acyltransferase
MHILIGVITSAVILPFTSKQQKLAIIQWWSTKLTQLMHLEVNCTGAVPVKQTNQTGRMYIANHISWLDIYALMTVTSLRFIAKSDIRKWPVFGYLAANANVLFIDREKRHDAAKIVKIAIESLNNGDQLCFFPEGTTTDGTQMLNFRGSLIQAPIDTQSNIQPVAIFYPNDDGSANLNMAYIGDMTMIESIFTILKQRQSRVELYFFEEINILSLSKEEKDRRTLTNQLHQLIHQKLYSN